MQPAKKGVRNLLKSVWSGDGSYIYNENCIWFCCRPEEETTNTPRHTIKCPDNKIFCHGVKSTSTVTDGQVGKSQTQARIIALRTGSYNMLWQVTPLENVNKVRVHYSLAFSYCFWRPMMYRVSSESMMVAPSPPNSLEPCLDWGCIVPSQWLVLHDTWTTPATQKEG